MLVSIIIPNYNHAQFLHQRIDSVLNQTYQNFEMIILDDCSSDNSREIIEKFRYHPKIKEIIYNERNSGSTFKQWQKGIEIATGEFIWIAESDDYCESSFLENVLKGFDNNENIGLSYCKSIRVDKEGNVIDDLSFWYQDLDADRWQNPYINNGRDEVNDYLSYKNTIPNASAVLFRKDLVNFDFSKLVQFKLCGDWYFWLQILSNSDIAFSNKGLNFFRLHSSTVRNKTTNENAINKERQIINNFLVNNKFHELRNAKKLQSHPLISFSKNLAYRVFKLK